MAVEHQLLAGVDEIVAVDTQDRKILAENPPADIELAKIGDLLNCDLATFLKKR